MAYPSEDIPIGALNLVLDRVNIAIEKWQTEILGSPILDLFGTGMDFWDVL